MAPRRTLETPIEMIERRMRAVDKPPSGCWIWPGAKDSRGYASITLNRSPQRRTLRVSRVVLATALGRELVAQALHHGDNALCVNPAHLYEGDQSRNMLDAYERRRRETGESSHLARLTDAEVDEIRGSTEPSGVLATRFRTSRQHIWALRTGRERRYPREEIK